MGSIDQCKLLNNAHLCNSLAVGVCTTEEVAGEKKERLVRSSGRDENADKYSFRLASPLASHLQAPDSDNFQGEAAISQSHPAMFLN